MYINSLDLLHGQEQSLDEKCRRDEETPHGRSSNTSEPFEGQSIDSSERKEPDRK